MQYNRRLRTMPGVRWGGGVSGRRALLFLGGKTHAPVPREYTGDAPPCECVYVCVWVCVALLLCIVSHPSGRARTKPCFLIHPIRACMAPAALWDYRIIRPLSYSRPDTRGQVQTPGGTVRHYAAHRGAPCPPAAGWRGRCPPAAGTAVHNTTDYYTTQWTAIDYTIPINALQ